jgi:secreted trypsin-like serine protease
MKVDLRVMETPRCQKLPGYGPQKIHANVICAAHPQRSTCQGDSGGAITLTNGAPTVVGVVSWGKKRCSGDGQPGAYTRVASYIDWIRQAMRSVANQRSAYCLTLSPPDCSASSEFSSAGGVSVDAASAAGAAGASSFFAQAPSASIANTAARAVVTLRM